MWCSKEKSSPEEEGKKKILGVKKVGTLLISLNYIPYFCQYLLYAVYKAVLIIMVFGELLEAV